MNNPEPVVSKLSIFFAGHGGLNKYDQWPKIAKLGWCNFPHDKRIETEWVDFDTFPHVQMLGTDTHVYFDVKVQLRRTAYDMYEVTGENRYNSFGEARHRSRDPPSIVVLLKNAESLYVRYDVVPGPI